MARRPRLFAADLLYHVIVRGNQRQKTFLTEADYQAYLERLARYRKKYDYCVEVGRVPRAIDLARFARPTTLEKGATTNRRRERPASEAGSTEKAAENCRRGETEWRRTRATLTYS